MARCSQLTITYVFWHHGGFCGLAGIIAFPQNVTIPVGSNGTFVCKSNSSIVWIVDQGSGNNILSANHNVPSLSFFNTSTGYTSTYTLSGEASNNITRVWCVSSYLELAHYLDNVNRPAVSLQLYGRSVAASASSDRHFVVHLNAK